MSEEAPRIIATGFKGGSKASGLSERTLRYAANDPNPQRRLRTVWYGRRRLIRFSDLQDWLERVLQDDKPRVLQDDKPRVLQDDKPKAA